MKLKVLLLSMTMLLSVFTTGSVNSDKLKVNTSNETENTTEEVREDASHTGEDTDKTTEEATTEAPKAGTVVTVVISPGMSSEDVSSLLKDAGIVKDAEEYNTFLMTKGYDSKLLVGTFEIKVGASDKEIAEALTTPTE